jgi:hypothetical protein
MKPSMYAIEQTAIKHRQTLLSFYREIDMIVFIIIIMGTIVFSSLYGLNGFLGFLVVTSLIALLARARHLHRI